MKYIMWALYGETGVRFWDQGLGFTVRALVAAGIA